MATAPTNDEILQIDKFPTDRNKIRRADAPTPIFLGKILCCYYSIHLALEISTVKPKSVDQPTGDQADSHTAKQQRGRFSCFHVGILGLFI